MKIHTYFEDIGRPQDAALLSVWRDAWTRAGWEPVVIGEKDARRHPLLVKLDDHFNKWLPTINPFHYERACYRRWLAMEAIGGGWMSDSDVIPYGYTPRPHATRLTLYAMGSPSPFLTSGPASEYGRIARIFLSWRGPTETIMGRPHASDQNILQRFPGEYEHIQEVAQYMAQDWENAEVVHYPNASMEGKQPRAEWIPKLRTDRRIA